MARPTFSSANPGAVGLDACQFQVEPVVAVAGVFEEHIGEDIAGISAADDGVNVLVPVVVDISEGDAVSLLQVPETPGSGYILEEFSPCIAKHPIGH